MHCFDLWSVAKSIPWQDLCQGICHGIRIVVGQTIKWTTCCGSARISCGTPCQAIIIIILILAASSIFAAHVGGDASPTIVGQSTTSVAIGANSIMASLIIVGVVVVVVRTNLKGYDCLEAKAVDGIRVDDAKEGCNS